MADLTKSITPFHSDYARKNANIDTALKTWSNNRSALIRQLTTDSTAITRVPDFFGIDTDCLYNMNKYRCENVDYIGRRQQLNLGLRRKYKCNYCRLLDLFIDFDSNEFDYRSNNSFSIETGQRKGQKLYVRSKKVDTIRIINTFVENNSSLIDQEPNDENVCPQYEIDLSESATYLQSSPSLNAIMVNWYVNYLLNQYNVNHVETIQTGFICGNRSYLVTDVDANSDFDSFISRVNEDTVVFEMLSQIFITLRILKSSDFTLGTKVSMQNRLAFQFNPIEYDYDDFNVKANFNVKLIDFFDDSITVNETKTRMFPYATTKTSIEPSKYNSNLVTVKKIFSYGESESRYVFDINLSPSYSFDQRLFDYLRQLGIPFYSSSINSYIVMIELMQNVKYRNLVLSSEMLTRLWQSLWLPDQYDDVMKNLTVKPTSYMLIKYSLRCDCVDFIWNFIKQVLT
jgi:hypothetical protein